MYILTFDTEGQYDMAWHETDWCFELGYFSTEQLAEKYIEACLSWVDGYHAKQASLKSKIREHQGKIKNLGNEGRRSYYNKFIAPLNREVSENHVPSEWACKEHYKIKKIEQKEFDKPFNDSVLMGELKSMGYR